MKNQTVILDCMLLRLITLALMSYLQLWNLIMVQVTKNDVGILGVELK
jgi:hypothetical protein